MNWFDSSNPYRNAPLLGIGLAFGIMGGIPPLIAGAIVLIVALFDLIRSGIFYNDLKEVKE